MTDKAKWPYIVDCASIDHDKLDGAKLKADGCCGIIARAELGTINDPDFAKHRAAAIDAGLMWGGYFAPRWDLPIEAQVQAFFKAMGDLGPGHFWPAFDVEEGKRMFDGQPIAVVVAKCVTIVQMTRARYGCPSIDYTSFRVGHEGLHDADLSAVAADSVPWLAEYGSYFKDPKIPPAWVKLGKPWVLHQFAGDSPKVPGATGNVDLSRFNPALGDMRAFFDAGWPKVCP